jgi:hypothetical protein
VDVVQDEYANAEWTQREQLLDARKLEATIQEGLRTNVALEAKVACSFTRRPAVPGTRFVCVAQPANATATFEIPVVIKDTKGQVDWSVPKSALERSANAPKVKRE